MIKRTDNTRFSDKRVFIKLEEQEEYRHKTLDPDFNGAVFNYLTQVLYLNKLNKKNFTYKVCKEKFTNNKMVFYLRKHFYIRDEFNLLIRYSNENGLMNFWQSNHLDFGIIDSKKFQGPKKLSFRELLGSFEIYGGIIFIAILIFLLEIGSKKFVILRKLF